MTAPAFLIPLLALGNAASEEAPRLRIDPLLLAEVVEVYQIIADDENPVWPGWNASDTPILLYLPNVQDALLNHPSPPEGFVLVDTPLLPEGWTLHLRDGETVFEFDGQNTSTDVGGVETLVVADTISNLRPQLLQLMRDPRDVNEKQERLDLDLLATDPYGQLGFVVHEAFHVHQYRATAGKAGNEMALLSYPWLSATNNAGFALEGLTLARALEAQDFDDAYVAALEWLAVRLDRRAALSPESIAYEDGTEFNEGLAKYTEWRLLHVLEGREPGAAMRWARDFRGYEDLGFWRAQMLERVRSNLAGEVIVNNDPYGSGMLRFRLYDSGMAIGALLDKLEADGWRERMFEPGTTLTGLAQEVLFSTDEDQALALERARASCDYEALLADKRELEEQGFEAAHDAAARILAGDALFTLDYSALGDASVAWSLTPFGITRVDDARTIYSQIPVGARIGNSASFEQKVASPALHDTARHRIQFQLADRMDAGTLEASLSRGLDEPLEDIDLLLPGVQVRAAGGRFVVDEGGVTLVLSQP